MLQMGLTKLMVNNNNLSTTKFSIDFAPTTVI